MPSIIIWGITCTDNRQSCNNMKLSDFNLYLYYVYILNEHTYVKTIYDFKYKTHNAYGLQWRFVASVDKWQYSLTLIYIYIYIYITRHHYLILYTYVIVSICAYYEYHFMQFDVFCHHRVIHILIWSTSKEMGFSHICIFVYFRSLKNNPIPKK